MQTSPRALRPCYTRSPRNLSLLCPTDNLHHPGHSRRSLTGIQLRARSPSGPNVEYVVLTERLLEPRLPLQQDIIALHLIQDRVHRRDRVLVVHLFQRVDLIKQQRRSIRSLAARHRQRPECGLCWLERG